MRLINFIALHFLIHLTTITSLLTDEKHLSCDFSKTEWEPLDSAQLYTCDIFTQKIDSDDFKIIKFEEHDSEIVEGIRFNENENLNYLPENIGDAFPNILGLYAMKTYLTVINVNDLKGLKKLKYLNLANTDLKVIEEGVFSDLGELVELDLSDSDIRHINENAFQGLKALKSLFLGANKLSQLEAKTFNPLVSLESISLELNHLVEIDDNLFTMTTKLADIWLNGNKITAMNWQVIENIKSLAYIDVQNNLCVDGAYYIQNINDLKTILKEKCTKSFVEEVTEYVAVSKVKGEYRLDGSFDDGSFSQYMKIFKSTTNLEIPDFDNDPSTKVIECFETKIYWRLSDEELSTCEFDDQSIDAKDFRILGNGFNLKAVTFNNNKHVKYLPFSIAKFSPNIVEFSAANSSLLLINNKNFVGLKHLRSLNLANNNIKFIDPDAFDDLTSLEELDLSGNELETIDEELFAKLKNLKVLRLGSNKMHAMPRTLLRSMRNLIDFSMSHQYISTIDENIFKTNMKLKNIYMNSNKLKSISPNMFNNLKALEYVDVRDNKCIDSFYDQSVIAIMKNEILAKCGAGYELKLGKKAQVKATSKKNKPKKEKKKKEKLKKVESEEQKEVTCEYEDVFWAHVNRTLRTCIIRESIDDPNYFLSANPIVAEEFVETEKVEAISFASNKNIKFLPQNIADVFPNLIEMSAANSGITEIYSNNFKNLHKLKSLNLSGNEIKLLHGDVFEDLTELEELNLDENDMEEFDEMTFTYTKKIKKLKMSGNKYKTFNYSWFNELTELHEFTFDTPEDSLINLHIFTTFPKLKWISWNKQFYNDKMELIDDPEMTQTYSNPFGSDFSGIINEDIDEEVEMVEIDCFYGENLNGSFIEDPEICSINEDQIITHHRYSIKHSPKNAQVKKFVMRNNHKIKFFLQNLGISFPILENIDVEHTGIASMDRKYFQNLAHLETLKLDFNRIKSFESDTFDDLNFLKELSMKGNLMEILEEGIFNMLRGLKKIDLSGNALHYIHPKTFKFLKKLNELLLDDNQLTVVEESSFKFNPNLEKISFSGNKIETMNPKIFYTLRKLKFIYLSGNNCVNGTFNESQMDEMIKQLNEKCSSGSGSSKEIYCEVNSEEDADTICLIYDGQSIDERGFIITVDPETFDANKVETLKMANNHKIKFLPENVGEIFPNLKNFYASNLSLDDLPRNSFKNLINLETLDLSSNKLKQFDPNTFTDLLSLHSINLGGNEINFVDDSTFEKLPSLKTIDLSGNKINHVTPNAFKELPHLESLTIDEDDEEFFTYIEHSIIKRKKAKKIVVDYDEGQEITPTQYYDHYENTVSLEKTTTEAIDTLKSKIATEINKDLNCDIVYQQWNDTNPVGLLSCVIRNQPVTTNDFKIISTPTTLQVQEVKIENDKNVQFLPENLSETFPKLMRMIARNLSLEDVPEDAFENLINLAVIDLSHNKLKSLNPNLFNGLSNLEDINLSGNNIEELPENIFTLVSLRRINLNDNKITKINKTLFENLPNLEKVTLNGNSIDDFSIFSNPKFEIDSDDYLSSSKEITEEPADMLKSKNNIQHPITESTNAVDNVPSLKNDLADNDSKTKLAEYPVTEKTENEIIQDNITPSNLHQHRGSDLKLKTERPLQTTTQKPASTRTTTRSTTTVSFKEIDCNVVMKYSKYFENDLITCDLSLQTIDNAEVALSLIPNRENVNALNFDNNPNIKFLPENIGEVLPNLRELSAKKSVIESILPGDFQNLKQLENIDLSGNSLKSIEPEIFDNLPHLKNLDLSENQIEIVDEDSFGNLPSLKVLNLKNNLITFFDPKTFEKLPNLESLNIEGNTIPSLRQEIFSRNPHLRNFGHNLNHFYQFTTTNKIETTTSRSTFLNEEDEIFVPKSKEIECEYGNIYWTDSDAELFTCDLTNAEIEDPNFFVKQSPRNKRVKGLSFLDNKKVKYLPMNIGSSFPNLVEISAFNSSLRKISANSLKNLPKLKSLNLMVSDIDEVHSKAFESLISLQNLELSDNKIYHLNPETFKNNPRLKALYLNNNELHSIDPKLFEELPELRNISLENNKISSIPRRLFIKNYELTNIWLNNNKLRYIDPTTFDGKGNLEYLDIRGNECIDKYFDGHKIEGIRNELRKNCGAEETSTRNPKQTTQSTYSNYFTTHPGNSTFPQHKPQISLAFTPFYQITTKSSTITIQRPEVTSLRPQQRFTSTTQSSIKELKCKYTILDGHSLQCIILNQPIDDRGYVIKASKQDFYVTDLIIEDNKNIKFLPENIPTVFHNLLRILARNNSIIDVFPNNFENLRKLKILNLADNDLSIIDPEVLQQKLPSLEELILSSNHIPLIINETFNNLPKLSNLDLSQNEIIEINPKAFSFLPELRKLSLQNNKIFEIPARIFEENLKLEDVNLSNNKIHSIDPRTFRNLPRLKNVNLGENNCISGDYEQGTLRALDVDVRRKCKPHYSHDKDEIDAAEPNGGTWGVIVPKEVDPLDRDHDENSNEVYVDEHFDKEFVECDIIEEYSSFARSTVPTCKIGSDKMIKNEWKIEDTPRTKRVKRLAIDDNMNVHSLPTNIEESFPDLIELEVSNTPLKTIHPENFKNLRNLKSLKLPGNSIKFVEANSFIELPHLQTLALNNNNLRDIDENAFRNLPHLTNLDLSNNKLPKIHTGILKNLSTLKTFNLSNNDLHHIDQETFKFNPQIYSIDLSNNNLESIEPSTFELLPHLINLDLRKNECIDRKFSTSSMNPHQLNSVINEHCRPHKSLKSELKTCHRLVENCKREIQTRPMELQINEDREKENLRNLLQKNELKTRHLNLQLKSLQLAFAEEKELHRREIEKSRNLEQKVKNCAKIDESHNFLVDIECEFLENASDYSCNAKKLKVNTENTTVERVNGEHKRGKRNSDVTSLTISNQDVKFLPNKISKILPNLKNLKISNSKLLKLTNSPFILPKLTSLVINNNQIRHIDPATFNNLPQLKELDLSQNYIKQLPSHIFEMLPNLKELSLSDNSLTALPHDIISRVNNIERFAANNNQLNFIDPRLLKKLKSAKAIELKNANCIDENYDKNAGDEIVRLMGEISLHCIIDDDDDDDVDENERFCRGRKG